MTLSHADLARLAAAHVQLPLGFFQRISCTVNQACEATGIGRTKIYEEIAAGRIETTKVGRRTLIRVRSLISLLDPEMIVNTPEPHWMTRAPE
jgi:excisionase family DNA binding protein